MPAHTAAKMDVSAWRWPLLLLLLLPRCGCQVYQRDRHVARQVADGDC